jgi:hypothetical protein
VGFGWDGFVEWGGCGCLGLFRRRFFSCVKTFLFNGKSSPLITGIEPSHPLPIPGSRIDTGLEPTNMTKGASSSILPVTSPNPHPCRHKPPTSPLPVQNLPLHALYPSLPSTTKPDQVSWSEYRTNTRASPRFFIYLAMRKSTVQACHWAYIVIFYFICRAQ